jgi:GlpG protein
MRKLAELQDAKEARRMADALLVAGIEAEVRSDPPREVWVLDDEDLPAAREHLERFRRGELADAREHAEVLRREREREHRDQRQRTHDMSRRWGRPPGQGFGALTTFLIAGAVVVGLVLLFSDSSGMGMWNLTIDHWGSTQPFERVREGEVWRIVTPIFLHFGILHLVFNMLWMHRLGGQIEHTHGAGMMLALVLACAVAGNVGQYLASGPSFGGMSGVVYGLFAFVWMYARFDRRHAYVMGDGEVLWMMLWFIACATGLLGPIANVGHAAGLAVGLLFGLPPWIRHVRARGTVPTFDEGSWAAVHLHGFARFRRRFVTPWVPAWFLALAVGTIAIEQLGVGLPTTFEREACEEYGARVADCFQHLQDQEQRAAFMQEVERALGGLEDASANATDQELACARALPALDDVAESFGCSAASTASPRGESR